MAIINFLTINPLVEMRNTLIIFAAESNSGGVAFNSNALPSEIGLRKLNLWKNIENDGFYKCNIGVNNLLGHSGLPPQAITDWHGWELELSNQVDSGIFNENITWLVKCGQGGSTIAQWADGGSYYTTLKTRVDGALAAIADDNNYPIDVFVMYSQGINDAIAGTNSTTWYDSTIEFLDRLKTRYNVLHFYMTNIMPYNSSYISINDKITQIGTDRIDATAIATNWSYDYNYNHWGYTEMKRMAGVMLNYIKTFND